MERVKDGSKGEEDSEERMRSVIEAKLKPSGGEEEDTKWHKNKKQEHKEEEMASLEGMGGEQ